MLIVVSFDREACAHTAIVHRDEVPPTLWRCDVRGWSLVGLLRGGMVFAPPPCFQPSNDILAKLDEAADVLDASGQVSSVSRWPA